MGRLGKLFGGGGNGTGKGGDNPAAVAQDGMVALRRAALVAGMHRPKEPNFSDEPQAPCATCGKPLAELLITTGGPFGDPDVWRLHPIAVDGWACVNCGVFRYPRKIDPNQIVAISDQAVAQARAGQIADAEWMFARIVWNWPGYAAGHVNYAESIREHMHRDPPIDNAARQRMVQRMTEQYEEAIDAFVKEPKPPALVAGIARACLTIAETAGREGALDRARRYAEICAALPGVAAETTATANEICRYIDTRQDLFERASKVLGGRLHLSGRKPNPPATPDERAQIAKAIDDLEVHVKLAPDRWQSAWLYAKALELVGRDDEFDVWARAFERFPGEPALARDYSQRLLETDRLADAKRVATAIRDRCPDDATLWCNLAVIELLLGDLHAAEANVKRCLELDPNDSIAPQIRRRLADCRGGAKIPRTLRELEGKR